MPRLSSAQALLRVTVEALDPAFIDPANAGVPDVSPASITYGLVPVPWDVPDVPGSLAEQVANFAGDLTAAYLVTTPELGVLLSGATYPQLGARGGTMAGLPVLTSRSVPTGVVCLVDPSGIAFAEGEAELKTVTQGDVLMAGRSGDGIGGNGLAANADRRAARQLVANQQRRNRGRPRPRTGRRSARARSR